MSLEDDYIIPLKGSQSFVLGANINHILLYGSRGASKTTTQLLKFLSNVGKGYGAFWTGIILDTQYKSLTDIISQSKKFFYQLNDGAKFYNSASSLYWSWPTGEKLYFNYVNHIDDYEKIHGHEYCFIGVNEITKHPTPDLYDKILSTNRSSFVPKIHTPKDANGVYLTHDFKPLPEIPLTVLNTTNPSGAGRNWVKKRFIDVAPVGTVVKKVTNVFNPRTQKKADIVKTQVSIFASYKENIYLSPEYIADLENITDPNLRSAWLNGSWEHSTGGIFDDLWSSKIHVKPRFKIPYDWYIDRGFDWGSTHPFSVGWFAEANGEEVEMPDGSIFAPTKGSIILFYEWYGTDNIGTNKGLKLSAPAIAEGIVEIESALRRDEWVKGRIRPGPADNQIHQQTQSDVDRIGIKMEACGVSWTKSDKSPGSRINGVQLFRDRLEAAVKGEGPAFYVMQNCSSAIEILPYLQRDSKIVDDVDTKTEDHIWDMIRYRVLDSKIEYAHDLKVTFSH